MSRRVALALVLALASPARADDAVTESTDEDPDGLGDQGVGAELGIAGGGRVTPGGLRIGGHYLYQLSAQDWFDGIASFTFGSGDAACFRDRMDYVICDHGFVDGRGVEVTAAVRRYFTAQGKFLPFARLGAGVAIIRFGGDDVTGIGIPVHAGGGVRAGVSPGIAVVAAADLVVGFGRFGRGMGNEPLFGITIAAGAEFRLK